MSRIIYLAIIVFLLVILLFLYFNRNSKQIILKNFSQQKDSAIVQVEASSEDYDTNNHDYGNAYQSDFTYEPLSWLDSIRYINSYSDFVKTLIFDTLELLNRPDKVILKPTTKTYYTINRNAKELSYFIYDYKYPIFDLSKKEFIFKKINNFVYNYIYDNFKSNFPDSSDREYFITDTMFNVNFEEEHDNIYYLKLGKWYFVAEPEINFVSDKILTILYFTDQYSGGAHNLYYFFPFNFDLETGELIEFNEIITFNQECCQRICWYMRRLSYVEKEPQIRDNYAYNYFDPRFLYHFRITNSGLDIIFQIYEITCFAEGTQFYHIPWKIIEEYVNKDLIQLKVSKASK